MEPKVMSRGKYWIGVFIYFICNTIVSTVLGAIGNLTALAWATLIAWLVLGYIFKVMLAEPRIRDYGGDLKYSWLVFIPLVGTIYAICIGCYASKSN